MESTVHVVEAYGFIPGLLKIPSKRKTDEDKTERHKVYAKTKRQRVYFPEWDPEPMVAVFMCVNKNRILKKLKKIGLLKFLADE